MKLAVIGGGGVRSPFLAKSLVSNARNIGVDELVFMDDNAEKLSLFGNISKYIAAKIDPGIRFTITTDPVEAVKNADFVITTIRSGGDESRVFDERTALEHGVLGQETTGAGGFAMALRSIPVLMKLCENIRKHSNKNVLVFNFTNPSGLVTQALRDAGYDFVYGICDAPSGFEKQLIKLLGAQPQDFEMRCFGLNHLSWFRDFRLKGQDVYERIMQSGNLFDNTELRYFTREIVHLVGKRDLPNEYLYFFYYPDQALGSIGKSRKTRGETILNINARMIAALKKLNMGNEADMNAAFEIFIRHYMERESQYFAIESGTTRKMETKVPSLAEFVRTEEDGGYAGVALNFITAYVTGKPVTMVLSVPNRGALNFLRDNDVVEISCRIQKGEVTPYPVTDVDDAQKNLIQTIKSFERNTVAAIQNRDKNLAVKALMFHPLINSYNIASKLVGAYLERYKEYVGDWNY